jgi:hypothetical protein
MRPPQVAVLVLVMAAALAVPTARARADALADTAATHAKGTLHMAWHTPWGTPRASDHLVAACIEEDRRDTLVLTFDPGRDSDTFSGVMADLYIRALPGDTLGPMWWFGGGALSDVNLIIEYPKAGDGTWGPAPIAWKVNGFGVAHYDRTSGTGHLQIVFAVPYENAGPVKAGQRYAFARLLVLRGKPSKALCKQPICIEWASAGLTFDVQAGEEAAATSGGHRFVTWNGRPGASCGDFAKTPTGWKPGKPTR